MNRTILLISVIMISTLNGQEDIEKYLLTDSLQIEALVEQPLTESSKEKPEVNTHRLLGISYRQLGELSGLNQSLLTQGYGDIPEISLGWTYGSQVDIGEHISVGFNYMSNIFLSKYQQGPTHSSKYSYFTFLLNFGYRQNLGSIHLIPGLGLGFSQSILSVKPNNTESVSWSEFFANDDHIGVVSHSAFALSTDLSIGKYFEREDKKSKLLKVKIGMLFHPFDFGDPGISSGDFSVIKITGAPSLSNSGIYLLLTWG